jgi:Nucleoporin autopeptidase/Nucleoporin FG repeat region
VDSQSNRGGASSDLRPRATSSAHTARKLMSFNTGFGAGASAFGTSQPSLFGASSPPANQQRPAFGAAPPSAPLFGAPASQPAFGAPAPQPAFGSAPLKGAFGAPAFGAAPATSAFGAPAPGTGAFGAPAPNAFGAPAPSAFGAPATQSTFGAPASGAFGAPAAGAFGAAPTSSIFGAAAAPTPAFGQQSSAFGAAPSSGGGGLFGVPATVPAFGQPVSVGGLFGAPAQQTAPTFGQPQPPAFGASSAPAFGAAPVAGGGLFGGGAAAGNGLFGQPTRSATGAFGATAPAMTPSGGLFGTPASAAGAFGAPASGGLFGGGLAQQQQPGAPGRGTVGLKWQVVLEAEGNPPSQQKFSTLTMMPAFKGRSIEEVRLEDYELGNTKPSAQIAGAPAAAISGLFGAPPATAASSTSLFGQSAAARQGAFGAPANANAFGAVPAATGTFGAALSGGGGLLGAPAAASSQPAFGGFGAPAASSGGLFGASAAPAPVDGRPTFGQPTSGSNLFGTQAPIAPALGSSQPSLFGGLGAPATSGGGLFGAPAAASAPSLFGAPSVSQPSLFGAPAPQTNAFGAPSTTGGLFGAPAAPGAAPSFSGGGLFGNGATFQSSPFGAPAPQTAGHSMGAGLFGSAPASSGGFGGFGGSAPAPAPPGTGLFGGGAIAAPTAPSFGGFGLAPAISTATGGLNSGSGFGAQAASGGGLFGAPALTSGGLFGGGFGDTSVGGVGSGSGLLGGGASSGVGLGGGSGFGFGGGLATGSAVGASSAMTNGNGYGGQPMPLLASIDVNPFGDSSLFAGALSASHASGVTGSASQVVPYRAGDLDQGNGNTFSGARPLSRLRARTRTSALRRGVDVALFEVSTPGPARYASASGLFLPNPASGGQAYGTPLRARFGETSGGYRNGMRSTAADAVAAAAYPYEPSSRASTLKKLVITKRIPSADMAQDIHDGPGRGSATQITAGGATPRASPFLHAAGISATPSSIGKSRRELTFDVGTPGFDEPASAIAATQNANNFTAKSEPGAADAAQTQNQRQNGADGWLVSASNGDAVGVNTSELIRPTPLRINTAAGKGQNTFTEAFREELAASGGGPAARRRRGSTATPFRRRKEEDELDIAHEQQDAAEPTDEDDVLPSDAADEDENRPRRGYTPGFGARTTSAPISSRKDMFTRPSMLELQQMNDDELSHVADFAAGIEGIGVVEWLGETDVRGVNLDTDVSIKSREVVVYPDEDGRPEVGSGLNKRARVKLYGLWKKDKFSKAPMKNASGAAAMVRKLKAHCDAEELVFLGYDVSSGTWTFETPHF